MEFFGGILKILEAKMEVPEMYGWFHLFFFAGSIAAGVLLCRRCRGADEDFVRRLLLDSAILMLLLELYKQVVYSFDYDGSTITFDYQWYAFPFQFCSTPMYVSLLAGLVKNRKVHQALCAYLGTYSVFAGLCVMVYPAQVFIDTIGVNIQTMVCHGAMITLGIYLIFSGYVKPEPGTIRRAIPVFLAVVCAAMVMNEAAYRCGLLETETFNMLFISPYCAPSLPVYSQVQAVLPFPWCTAVYVGAFTLAAYLVLLVFMAVKHASRRSVAYA